MYDPPISKLCLYTHVGILFFFTIISKIQSQTANCVFEIQKRLLALHFTAAKNRTK